jgi:hypothetical protein
MWRDVMTCHDISLLSCVLLHFIFAILDINACLYLCIICVFNSLLCFTVDQRDHYHHSYITLQLSLSLYWCILWWYKYLYDNYYWFLFLWWLLLSMMYTIQSCDHYHYKREIRVLILPTHNARNGQQLVTLMLVLVWWQCMTIKSIGLSINLLILQHIAIPHLLYWINSNWSDDYLVHVQKGSKMHCIL